MQEEQHSHLLQDELTITIKPRNYKCPCNKSYLSYAALFTHIKQKHDGKPPGKISKPPSMYEKRGRPPTKAKEQGRDAQGKLESPTQINNYEHIFPPQTQQQKYGRLCQADKIIQDLADCLQYMPIQFLNKEHLNQIQAFSEMNVYLNTRMNFINLINGNISVADGFFQFSQEVCSRILWSRFEPFYLLFMLFLQFIIDSENNKKVLTEKTLDLFCQYVNDFIENHLQDMAGYYELQTLWVFKKENTTNIFYHFFKWTMHKRYVTFKINLANPQPKESLNHLHHPTQANFSSFAEKIEQIDQMGQQKIGWQGDEFEQEDKESQVWLQSKSGV